MWPTLIALCLALSPTTARKAPPRRRPAFRRPLCERLEDRTLPATFTVLNTLDSGPGSFRQAIDAVNADTSDSAANPDRILFDISANDPNHVCYGTNGITATTATDDSTIADLASAWPGGPVPAHSWWAIQPTSALPLITQPVVIDGYSQGEGTSQAASENTLGIGPLSQGHENGDGDNAVLRIELDGSLAVSGPVGLNLTGGCSTVEGLAINNFPLVGISTSNNGDDVIQGNFIGTDISGTLAEGNIALGIAVESNHNIIGGTTPAARNIVSGTQNNLSTDEYGNGILISDCQSNQVEGNLIGVGASGTSSLANVNGGIAISDDATDNTIGGTTADARNIISGNGRSGVEIENGAYQNSVEGNFIGTDVTGTQLIGNGNTSTNANYGFLVPLSAGDGNIIGGASYLSNGQTQVAIGVDRPTNLAGFYLAGAGNLISGQSADSGDGIGIIGGSGTQVYGNFIGTDVTGTIGVPNYLGLSVEAPNTVVGGPNGLGNLISGNGGAAFLFRPTATGGVIQGNLVGTDATGGADGRTLGNGVEVGANQMTIGGTAAGDGNVFAAGNVLIDGSPQEQDLVFEGNSVGTDRTGTIALGGSLVVDVDNSVTIGGSAPGAGNVIAYSGGDGIVIGSRGPNTGSVTITGNSIYGNLDSGVYVYSGSGNTILQNSIYDNGHASGPPGGIYLNSANNANNNQAAPVLTGVSTSGSGTTISGTLQSLASTSFRVEFFASPAPSNSTQAEGKTFLVSTYVTTDGSGNAIITASVLSVIPAGETYLTATATVATPNGGGTYTYGDTSQFSGSFSFPVANASLSGIVWEDFNDDGQVDFGENGISGVTIALTGTDDLGRPVSPPPQQTDSDGAYLFLNLRPGSYTITETQPAGYLQGIDSLGTAGGSLAATDQFFVQLGAGVNGLNYNYGERPPAGGSVQHGQTATIGFWNNRNGQNLIKALPVVTNADGSLTSVANWLAATLPNIFGRNAANDLTGQSNAAVAALFQADFLLKGVKLDAQVLATALSVYATNATLDPTRVAANYGFTVSGDGAGTATVNVGSNGDAFGVADNTTMTVMDLLLATNNQAVNGVLYGGNATKRAHANNVYSAVNNAGGI
jgi:hypothetical protein